MNSTPSLFAPGAFLATTSAALAAVFVAIPASGEYASEGRNLPHTERGAAIPVLPAHGSTNHTRR